MRKYIDVDTGLLRKRLSPRAVYVWVPVQLVRFTDCKPKEVYIVDCFFRSAIDNPYVSVLLLRRVPDPKKMRVLNTPPVKAREVEAECKDVATDLNQVAGDVVLGTFERLYKLMDEVYEYKDVEFTLRYFMRSKRYVIKGERIKEISKSIALKAIEGLMTRLCIYDKKGKKKLHAKIDTETCYALVYMDPLLSVSGIAIGKKLIDINAYLTIVRRFNMGSMFGLEFQEISPNTSHQMRPHSLP